MDVWSFTTHKIRFRFVFGVMSHQLPSFEIQISLIFHILRFNATFIVLNLLAMIMLLIYALLINKSGHTGVNLLGLGSLDLLFGMVMFVFNSFQMKRISFDNWLLITLTIALLILIGLFSSLNILVHYDNEFHS